MTAYHNPAPVNLTPIQAGETDINSVLEGLKGEGKLVGQAVDWVVSHFGDVLGLGDKGLYDYLVTPIAGKFGEMKANGAAWGDAARMLGLVQSNLAKNAGTLVTSDWRGEAAKAFFGHVDVMLVGGLYVAQRCSEWMQKGFEKLAELSEKVARKCVEIINWIIKKIVDFSKKLIPAAGQLIAIVEWVASGFDRAPYIKDVLEIRDLIGKVIALHGSITDLVGAMQGYYEGFLQAVNAVTAIPTVDSTAKAADVAAEFGEGREGMKEARENMKKAREKVDTDTAGAQQNLDNMANRVNATAGE